MRVGDLDRRVIIYTKTREVDEYGEEVYTDVALATVWAKVTPGSGGEGIDGNKPTATQKVMFTIRYRTDVNESMKILFDDEYYNIQAIEKPDRKRRLEITAEKQY